MLVLRRLCRQQGFCDRRRMGSAVARDEVEPVRHGPPLVAGVVDQIHAGAERVRPRQAVQIPAYVLARRAYAGVLAVEPVVVVEMFEQQLAHFLDFESKTNPARVLNNADWLMDFNLISFLRDVGKYFTVNYMMTKDSVRNRLEREDGISFTEFSYMLLQSYDFLHLYEAEGCRLQTGGSDQWGNITAGVELIRREKVQSAYGMDYALISK